MEASADDATENPLPGAGLPPLIADFYDEAPPSLKVRLLDNLLRPVGPLALVAIAAGAFGKLLPTVRWQAVTVTLDDVARISGSQVLELARYVEQKSPDVLLQLPRLLGSSPLVASTVSGALLLLVLSRWNRRRGLP
jgi:hypothetical protein